MQDQLNRFQTYYKRKHEARTLAWNHALGTATILARFKAGSKEISVSLYQAIILNRFNEQTELPFLEIAAETRIG